MTDVTKVFVQIGTARFKAVGSEAFVQDQCNSFMGAVATLPPSVFAETSHAGNGHPVNGKQSAKSGATESGLPEGYHEQWDDESPDGDAEDTGASVQIADDIFQRAFRVDDKSGAVSLRVLPNGKQQNEDALLLLIWGFQKVRGTPEVGAIELTEAVRASGINLGRIDRTIGRMHEYVRRGGRARGTRYQLNNQGESRAENLLKTLFS